MAEAAFNTIAEVQRLRDAGFEQAQAEAITLSIHAGVTGGVASKEDIARVEARLDRKIDALQVDLKWIKLIGGAILGVLLFPWLAEIIGSGLPKP